MPQCHSVGLFGMQASGNEDLPDTVRKTVWALTASGCFAGAEHLQVSQLFVSPSGSNCSCNCRSKKLQRWERACSLLVS